MRLQVSFAHTAKLMQLCCQEQVMLMYEYVGAQGSGRCLPACMPDRPGRCTHCMEFSCAVTHHDQSNVRLYTAMQVHEAVDEAFERAFESVEPYINKTGQLGGVTPYSQVP